MDHLALRIEHAKEQHLRPQLQLIIRINGRSLIDLVRPVELPFRTIEGHPEKAGDYGWLHPFACEIFVEPDEHETHLLGCTCGEADCWPIFGRITKTPNTVQWHSFYNPFRLEKYLSKVNCDDGRIFIPWDYAALGPFEFDRKQYEEAIATVQPLYEAERAKQKKTETNEYETLKLDQPSPSALEGTPSKEVR